MSVGTEFWEGDATKQKSVKRSVFSHSVNGGFGKEFHRKGNSVKRSGPFSESPDSANRNLLRLSPSQISAPSLILERSGWGSLELLWKVSAHCAVADLRTDASSGSFSGPQLNGKVVSDLFQNLPDLFRNFPRPSKWF